MTYDIVIKNARIIDGTGSPWFRADIGISEGKIQSMGAIEEANAKMVIDACSMVACPGFIDLHNHSGMKPFNSRNMYPYNLWEQIEHDCEGSYSKEIVAKYASVLVWKPFNRLF